MLKKVIAVSAIYALFCGIMIYLAVAYPSLTIISPIYGAVTSIFPTCLLCCVLILLFGDKK
ncbi:MAG TPA: hypothetical protein PLI19_02935 [Erysipelotrichaceae bacterium]|nr:hypothetical protein [Erysipelotrichaceae bacterium]HQB32266.1 hypothetical protein [Erysipelotrichaceae bacterium]